MPPRRLLYLDTLRGFAILFLIMLHALGGVVFGTNREAIGEVNPALVYAFAPIAILGTWAPLFALISGTANAYVLHCRLTGRPAGPERDALRRRMLIKGLKVAGLLYLLSVVNMTLMHHSIPFAGERRYTLLTGTIAEARFMPFSPELLFFNDALALIGMSVFATNIALYLLWRGGGLDNPKRTFLVNAAIVVFIFLLAPLLHTTLREPYFAAIDQGNHSVALALKLLIGPAQSPFPKVAYAFIGVLFGVALARGVDFAAIRRWGYSIGAALLAMGLALFVVQGFTPAELVAIPLSPKLHLVDLGGMLLLATWLASLMEFSSDARRAACARRTVTLRRFGMVALSVFILEKPVAAAFGKIYTNVLGIEFAGNPIAAIGFLILLYAFWFFVVRQWERIDFRYSFEWWVIVLTGDAKTRLARLDAQRVLYQPDHA